MKKDKHILVIGLGRFGQAVAETLWSRGTDVTVIDSNPALVDTVKGRSSAAFVADATDQAVLESVGASDMDAAVVTFGESFESAVLAVAALKALGVAEVIARGATARRVEVLRAVGATRVLEVEQEMGVRVAQQLLTPSAKDLLELASQYRVVPWSATGPVIGRSLKDSGLRQHYGINVIGVRPAGDKGTKLLAPSPEQVIRQGDTYLLVGEDSDMQRFIAEVGG